MRNLLHDEKDALQDVQEKWRQVVEQIKAELAGIASESIDFRELFTTANILAADELGNLTTEAAQIGFAFGQKKASHKGVIGGSDPDQNP